MLYLTNVLKRKGEKESFNPDKIRGSLQKAAIDAGYSVEEKKEIIEEVFTTVKTKFKDEKEVKSGTIRACLLTELERCEPYMAKSWRRFDKRYKSI